MFANYKRALLELYQFAAMALLSVPRTKAGPRAGQGGGDTRHDKECNSYQTRRGVCSEAGLIDNVL